MGSGLRPRPGVCPNVSGGRDGGPGSMRKALRGKVRCYAVGWLVDRESGAKEEWMLFLLCLEM